MKSPLFQKYIVTHKKISIVQTPRLSGIDSYVAVPMAPSLPPSLQKSLDESQVQYVRLGTSGLRVSVPILGAMSFGSSQWLPWVLDEDDSIEMLKAAYDRGLNTWDTADMYSNGISEEIIGKALKQHNIPRERVVIMTKCFIAVADQPDIFAGPWQREMSQMKDYVNRSGMEYPIF